MRRFVPRPEPSPLELARDELTRWATLPLRALRGFRAFSAETQDLRAELLVRARAVVALSVDSSSTGVVLNSLLLRVERSSMQVDTLDAVVAMDEATAARALGANPLQIMAGHLWSSVRPLALVQVVLVASASILAESSLSFLGLGDPSGKSWGMMLYFARASGAFLSEAWKWWVLPTGLMITLTVLSLGLIGYSLEQRVVRPQ